MQILTSCDLFALLQNAMPEIACPLHPCIFIRLLLWPKPTKSNHADCEMQCFLRNLRGAKKQAPIRQLATFSPWRGDSM